MSTSTSKRRSRRRRRSPAFRKQNWGSLLLKGLLAACVVGGFLLAYLDAAVVSRFEGKKWAIPAKVYASPLEFYVGAPIDLESALEQIKLLGYQPVGRVNRPGQVARSGQRLEIHTRGFAFPDGAEPSQRLVVEFSAGRVVALSDTAGAELGVARLEPLLMGGIYPSNNEDRLLVNLQQLPSTLIPALLAVEDRGFYEHMGVSPKSIARALVVNIGAGGVRQGGSTLTQQLVKNFYLSDERSLWRKGIEALMALLLEFHYSKEEILETYINEIYLGQQGQRAIHGFGLASEFYFGQPLEELSLERAALLVGLVKGASYYDPRRHPERALARRNLVIDQLVKQGEVSGAEGERAKQKPLGVISRPGGQGNLYTAYLDLVKRQLKRDYREQDLTSEGLRIFTSLSPLAQQRAQASVQRTLSRVAGEDDQIQGAMVVTSPGTGEVLALVGGRKAGFAGFNRALDALRPIGSLIKPAVYLAALEQYDRYNLVTPVDDGPFSVTLSQEDVWTPQNFDRKSHGHVPLHEALARSYNQAAARLGMEVGVSEVQQVLRRLGVTRPLTDYPALLLGAASLSPIEVASLYQTIASNGFEVPLRSIRSVVTNQGVLLSRYPLAVEQRFSPAVVHLLQYALMEVMREGTGRSAYQFLPDSMRVAGKTGTTNDLRDSWFAGYSADRLAVVWLGRDDNRSTRLTGSSGALRVWSDFMAQGQRESLQPTPVEGVSYLWVESGSGKRSGAGCSGARYMPFIVGSEPRSSSICRIQGPVVDWFRSWFD
ncbi:penicillin-binding protein 1B [Aestuariirhabdus litorea]|uniref:Penicillin-binding protein 1B n=1 Tax=Aestuariirhabdus litorea TaxID=2528527 RepID=A0A3P3VHN0_9GAMM|nr:penicillin-binding protein 1B [Aestuariirhabdus litorea]RRJ82240.1 penicillin-binding protein 1B [Aestuariirhabdus litorea]RWW92408.1 penicillin-binding protein 1B [Endozoicomonadaceae bacterium GTF-13]